jgi:hypothetical protein
MPRAPGTPVREANLCIGPGLVNRVRLIRSGPVFVLKKGVQQELSIGGIGGRSVPPSAGDLGLSAIFGTEQSL